eukprot:TRINITY_DN5819_c0_g1_i1.p1 TRINITY_DN5819_c0_g1~~TRINITY_DN5819_c0_g1_i1.p1  ORF type:complete len:1142 (+),score=307.29 TRINITY_DN5819_c0_g1_i1:151-3426(+)
MEENESKKRNLQRLKDENFESNEISITPSKKWKSSSVLSLEYLKDINPDEKILSAANSDIPFLHDRIEMERTNCDREVIHSLNQIQSHGFLFVVDAGCNVKNTTANLVDFTGYATDEVIGDSIFKLLKGFDISREEHDCRLEKKGGDRVPVHCVCHNVMDGTTIVECETGIDDGFQYGSNLSQFLSNVSKSNGELTDMMEVAAKTVKEVSGYDRVMIYQFDHKFNGKVIAESSDAEEKFLGLKFPASDIPEQARELFRKNRFRIIPDSLQQTSAIVPLKDHPIDLTMCSLRASSQIHLAYLQNMGVRASMTISIVVGPEKKLWGLIMCHKFEKTLNLSWSRRRYFNLLGNMVSAQVENCLQRKLVKERLEMELRISEARDTLIHLNMETSPYEKLFALFPSWKSMMECDGVMLITQGNRFTLGLEGKYVEHIVEWVDINIKDSHTFFSSECIEEMNLKIEPDGFCGFMYVRLKDARYAGLYFFRKEFVETIVWGGEPKKPDEKGNLSLRTSFKKFPQELRGHCIHWNMITVEYGIQIQSIMTRYIFRWWEEDNRTNLMSEKKEFEKLMRENESAKIAAKNRSAFFANVTHELRTPIHSILGSSEKLEEVYSTDAEGSIACSMIRSSGEHLLNLISDISDMSQLESSTLEITPSKFDFYSHSENMAQSLYQNAHTKGLYITSLVPNDVPTLMGDSTRVGQIILNFISNAVKFTDEGGITFSVKIVSKSEDRITLLYSVADTGLGISQEEMKLLFLKYSQTEAGKSKRAEGTGLGLAISKNLAEAMGGSVWANSTVGKGSEFNLQISFPVIDPQSLLYSTVKREPSQTTVVVMDSRPFVLEFMKFHLNAWNLQLKVIEGLDEIVSSCDESTLGLFIAVGRDKHRTKEELEDVRKKLPNLIISVLENNNSKDFKSLGTNIGLVRLPLSLHRIHIHLNRTRNTMRESTTAFSIAKFSSMTKKLHVLVVEDNKMNQQIAQNFISSLGHSSEVVENGEAAVEALQTSRFDVVLMDVMMPIMDGITATKVIRQIEKSLRKEAVPIIGTSAGGDPALKRDCLEAGMLECIYKPFRKAHLEAVLLRIIDTMEKNNGSGTA